MEDEPIIHLSVRIDRERGSFFTDAYVAEPTLDLPEPVLVTALLLGMRRLLNAVPGGLLSGNE